MKATLAYACYSHKNSAPEVEIYCLVAMPCQNIYVKNHPKLPCFLSASHAMLPKTHAILSLGFHKVLGPRLHKLLTLNGIAQ